MMNQRNKKWSVLVVPVLLIILSFLLPDYQLDLIATAIIYGLFAASVDFSYGYAGILNLGSALYFGLGAYVMAFGLKSGGDPILLILIGLIVSIVISLIIGYVGFRVKASQVHFGLIGLALTLGFEQLAISLYDLTGGSNGISDVPRPVFHLFGFDLALSSPFSYFIFVIVIVSVLLYVLWNIASSGFGKSLLAMRHDETKLETLGYNPMTLKMIVTAITAGVSALAGALFVPISGIAYPGLFGVALSMSVLIWVQLGGTGTLVGPLLVAVLLKLTESSLSSSFEQTYMLIIGLIFVVMVIVAPSGVWGLLRRFIRKRKQGQSPVQEGGESA